MLKTQTEPDNTGMGNLVQKDDISSLIRTIRGQKVILDFDLARIYGVPTKALNRAVKRNLERFPDDFIFQLTLEELANLKYQIGTSSSHGGKRKLPYAFTENGAIMAANVLNSPAAVRMSVFVVRVPPLRDADARPAGRHERTRAPTGRLGKETDRSSGCAGERDRGRAEAGHGNSRSAAAAAGTAEAADWFSCRAGK